MDKAIAEVVKLRVHLTTKSGFKVMLQGDRRSRQRVPSRLTLSSRNCVIDRAHG